ncbi:4-amino-4-deoxy-L-arabinose transferase [Phenylobacterium sp. Root77]|uniref:ArnT family glycosyltransferase n=1 Tax=unclassified Phenylobacterium TaxID=2640670 RepID=UPI0006FBDC4B|nr:MULTISPECIES: glycosyltransferase family 39 protein [unclassified Phenylobacterium]KQW73337.1 4-amino-4-deoxy-L-arabinose transferase [Phenylobacterium sp. Root1277]KQW92557.1 4-amino-4-deoxy-L-arabinose transferase [Phenylobacterium sp. Root1290]KRC40786.1 4-amino-4-deoxy-L-arabinose transferase [Phenylobacterium sp. Root77]
MSLQAYLDRFSRGWRAPAFAALIALLAGLPGVFAMPPLDRDESRFAQATAQMLETGDFVVIQFQDQPRFKKPVGIHWMQAGSVALVSQVEDREIWAYRLPSLLGAMLAAAACAWGAAVFFGGPTGLLAGAILGSTFLLSTEAFIAKTDAVLAGTTTLALAALARIYAASRDGPPAGRLTRLLFWLGLSLSMLVKGPVGLMVVTLTALALWAWDRKGAWLKGLGWGWGLILMAAIVGPWAAAVTVATDGGFWTTAFGADFAPKLVGGQESHGAPPGYHTLLTPLLIFPGALLLPAALALGWRARHEPGVRFALCWLIPAFIVFEATPTKLVHYTLPTYGALAWLMAAAVMRPPIGSIPKWLGIALSSLVGVVFAAAIFYLYGEYGDPSDLPATIATALLLAAAGLSGAFLMWRGDALKAITVAGALTILGHGAFAAAFAPRLEPLWLSQRSERVLEDARLLPRQGFTPAPIAVAGFAEPSLVFALGTPTDLGDVPEAIEALADQRPAVVEGREQAAFEAELKARGLKAREIGKVEGLNYSNGDETTLRIYAPAPSETP